MKLPSQADVNKFIKESLNAKFVDIERVNEEDRNFYDPIIYREYIRSENPTVCNNGDLKFIFEDHEVGQEVFNNSHVEPLYLLGYISKILDTEILVRLDFSISFATSSEDRNLIVGFSLRVDKLVIQPKGSTRILNVINSTFLFTAEPKSVYDVYYTISKYLKGYVVTSLAPYALAIDPSLLRLYPVKSMIKVNMGNRKLDTIHLLYRPYGSDSEDQQSVKVLKPNDIADENQFVIIGNFLHGEVRFLVDLNTNGDREQHRIELVNGTIVNYSIFDGILSTKLSEVKYNPRDYTARQVLEITLPDTSEKS